MINVNAVMQCKSPAMSPANNKFSYYEKWSSAVCHAEDKFCFSLAAWFCYMIPVLCTDTSNYCSVSKEMEVYLYDKNTLQGKLALELQADFCI